MISMSLSSALERKLKYKLKMFLIMSLKICYLLCGTWQTHAFNKKNVFPSSTWIFYISASIAFSHIWDSSFGERKYQNFFCINCLLNNFVSLGSFVSLTGSKKVLNKIGQFRDNSDETSLLFSFPSAHSNSVESRVICFLIRWDSWQP